MRCLLRNDIVSEWLAGQRLLRHRGIRTLEQRVAENSEIEISILTFDDKYAPPRSNGYSAVIVNHALNVLRAVRRYKSRVIALDQCHDIQPTILVQLNNFLVRDGNSTGSHIDRRRNLNPQIVEIYNLNGVRLVGHGLDSHALTAVGTGADECGVGLHPVARKVRRRTQ